MIEKKFRFCEVDIHFAHTEGTKLELLALFTCPASDHLIWKLAYFHWQIITHEPFDWPQSTTADNMPRLLQEVENIDVWWEWSIEAYFTLFM